MEKSLSIPQGSFDEKGCAAVGHPKNLANQVAPMMVARYDGAVRVIARGTLNGFVRNRVDRKLQKAVKAHLDAGYAEAAEGQWKTSAELKSQYSSASIVSAEWVVFNIKGNDYRLVVAINITSRCCSLSGSARIRNTTTLT